MNKKATFLTCAALLTAMSTTAFAAEATDTSAELNDLKMRLAALEQRIDAQDKALKASEEELAKYKKNTAAAPAKSKNDDWKFYGDARIRAIKQDGDDSFHFQQRVRLNLEKRIGKNATFRVRDYLMNENTFGESGSYTTSNAAGTQLSTTESKDTTNKLDNVYVQFDSLGNDPILKNTMLKIGRFGHNFGTTGYWSNSGSLGMYDGVEFQTKMNKFTIGGGFGDWGAAKAHDNDYISVASNGKASIKQGKDSKGTTSNKLEKNFFVKLGYAPNSSTRFQLWHINELKGKYSAEDYRVTGIGFEHQINKNFTLAADYSRNTALDGDPAGTVAVLTYKGAKFNKPHSYGLSLYYVDVDKYNVAYTSCKSVSIPASDNKGIGLSLSYTLAKDIRFDFFTEFDMEKKSTGEKIGDYYRAQVTLKF
ncbi:MAG: hypothetical protein SPL45_00215 [Schwartzia succinivorans]|nr:hypothetical protein [Schwartzia succinivorans]